MKVKVRCPKCGEEFEVKVPVIDVTGHMPSGRILLLEEPHTPISAEAAKVWENRKRQIVLEQ